MANEAFEVDRSQFGTNYDYTVADGVGISKGTLMRALDGRTAMKSAGAGEPFAGVKLSDKEINDGEINGALAQDGIWDLRSDGGHVGLSAGSLVKISGANLITGPVAEADIIAGEVVGTLLEDLTTGTAETVEVDIGKR